MGLRYNKLHQVDVFWLSVNVACRCDKQLLQSRNNPEQQPQSPPRPMAVAAPTAFASASVPSGVWPRVKPRAIAAAKLSPHPTVSCTGTCRVHDLGSQSMALRNVGTAQ